MTGILFRWLTHSFANLVAYEYLCATDMFAPRPPPPLPLADRRSIPKTANSFSLCVFFDHTHFAESHICHIAYIPYISLYVPYRQHEGTLSEKPAKKLRKSKRIKNKRQNIILVSSRRFKSKLKYLRGGQQFVFVRRLVDEQPHGLSKQTYS